MGLTVLHQGFDGQVSKGLGAKNYPKRIPKGKFETQLKPVTGLLRNHGHCLLTGHTLTSEFTLNTLNLGPHTPI